MKKLVAFWKERAGQNGNGDGEELEEIQEERVSKEKPDGRHSM